MKVVRNNNFKMKIAGLLCALIVGTGSANAQEAPESLIKNLAQVAQTAEPEPEEPAEVKPADEAEKPAEDAEGEEEKKRFQFRGYQSTSYSVNFDKPVDRTNQFRVYDFDDRELKFDLLNLDFQYNVADPGSLGFRFDLTAGQTHPRVDAALGLFRNSNTGVSNTGIDFRQAYVTYMTDGGLRFDVGKFATHIGYELMDGVDGANQNATRSWAFAYGPFTHTGGKVSYEFNDKWSASGTVTTGWDQFNDANSSLSYGAQLGYKPTEDVGIYFNYITGPENAGNNSDSRRLFDISATWQVHEKIALGTNLLWGKEENGVAPGFDANWSGVVAYLGTDLTDEFSLNFRYEWFNDPDGTRTGTGQYLEGLTISPTYEFNDNWMMRADLRFDTSSAPVFLHGANPAASQSTLFFNNVLRF